MFSKLVKVITILSFFIVTSTLFYFIIGITFFEVDYQSMHSTVFLLYYIICIIIFICKKIKRFDFNTTLLNMLLIYIFFSIFIGSFMDLYNTIAIFSSISHFVAGALFSILMLNLFYSLIDEPLRDKSPKILVFLFIVSTTITLGVVWEVYEFLMDTFFSANMQTSFYATSTTDFYQYVDSTNRFIDPSLMDTMIDLIADCISALISSLFLIIYSPLNFYNKFLKN